MTLIEKYYRIGDGTPVLFRGQWATATAYAVDDLVYNDGGSYICLLAHTSGGTDDEPGTGATEATYWSDFCQGTTGAKGDTGSAGSIAFEGAWITGTAYHVGDILTHAKSGYGDQGYVCTSAHTSGATTEPEVGASWATKWTVIAGGGTDGAGSGTLTKSGAFVTDQICTCADTGYAVKAAGAPATVINAVLVAETASTTAPVGATDSLVVDENGTMKRKTADSFAKKYIHVNIKAGSWLATITGGCGAAAQSEMATSDFNLFSLGFAHSAKTYATADFELPDAYDGGTISAYVTWYSTGTTSNGVRFGIQGTAIGNDQTLDVTWGSAVEVTDTATGAANKRLKTAVMSAITLARAAGSPTGGDTCALRLYRDPTHGDDVLNETVYVVGVKLKIGVNKHSE